MTNLSDETYQAELDAFVKAAAEAIGCLPHPDAIARNPQAAKLFGVHPATTDRWGREGRLKKKHLGPNVAGFTLRVLFDFLRSSPTENPHPRALGVREYWRNRSGGKEADSKRSRSRPRKTENRATT